MKWLLSFGVMAFALGVAMALGQLWFGWWSAEIFVKTEISLGAVLAFVVVVWFVRKEYQDYRRQHSDPSLDA